jgi:putative mRNA 3-end processing factor
MSNLLETTPSGLYCRVGDFYLDPTKPVPKAIISHAHADHARPGMGQYISHPITAAVMKRRIAADLTHSCLEYGEQLNINGVQLSLHPAGHIPGSSQIRVEYKGEVWVYSGDYNTEADPTFATFEPIKCNTFITESTFGLPIFKWRESRHICNDIKAWVSQSKEEDLTPVLLAYSLGKAQRLIAGLKDLRFALHGSVSQVCHALSPFIDLSNSFFVNSENIRTERFDAVIAPPNVFHSNWLNRFGPYSCGFVSGWMAVRANKKKSGYEKGFVISDHADFQNLVTVIKTTRASKVLVTHGYTTSLSRYLNEIGIDACELELSNSELASLQSEEEP